jgi:hypothetical protein
MEGRGYHHTSPSCMDREQFTDAVRQYVEETAKARAAEEIDAAFGWNNKAPRPYGARP